MKKYYHVVGKPTSKECNGSCYDNYIQVRTDYKKGRGYVLTIEKVGKYYTDDCGELLTTSFSLMGDPNNYYRSCIVPCTRRSKKKEEEADTYAERFAGGIILDYFPGIQIEEEVK